MRHILAICGVLAACALPGCVGSPPKPPLPKGDYRPINDAPQARDDVFDFTYAGDILGVLPALKVAVPQISVMSAVGVAKPLPVRLDLRGVRLEDALRAIGAQGRDVIDVVWWNTSRRQGGYQIYIRFRSPPESAGIQGISQ